MLEGRRFDVIKTLMRCNFDVLLFCIRFCILSPFFVFLIYIYTTYDVHCISQYLYQRYSHNLFGVVSIAQLVEVTDSAVLGGVAEVVSSNPAVGHKNIFQHLPA